MHIDRRRMGRGSKLKTAVGWIDPFLLTCMCVYLSACVCVDPRIDPRPHRTCISVGSLVDTFNRRKAVEEQAYLGRAMERVQVRMKNGIYHTHHEPEVR